MSGIALRSASRVFAREGAVDPSPFLKSRKSRKYMGLQDDMAVVAAGRALEAAGLAAPLGPRVGLYLAVGHIPFEEKDIVPVLEASLDEAGDFDIGRFSRVGYPRANPLLTFRCLPNMPAFHVSVNFGIEGPYFVTYPGLAAFYDALEEATVALARGRIDIALVGGVAHQENFLVRHHFGRHLTPGEPKEELADAAAFVVLERGPADLTAHGSELASAAGVRHGAPYAVAAEIAARREQGQTGYVHDETVRSGHRLRSTWTWADATGGSRESAGPASP
ncbi:MAG: hypothetical protein HOO96_28315 [Polyangiaceae bacterium]|nr:hypothetical protein [Polyangiaceae bacterium]